MNEDNLPAFACTCRRCGIKFATTSERDYCNLPDCGKINGMRADKVWFDEAKDFTDVSVVGEFTSQDYFNRMYIGEFKCK